MALKSYTTEVSASQTVGEIQQLLADAGASKIMIEYDQRKPRSISFIMIDPDGQAMPFRLAANPLAVQAVLRADGVQPKYRTIEHAEKVAWRHIRDWIDAQLAIMRTGQASAAQLLLGFAVMNDDETLYERITSETGRKLLAEHL